MTRPLSRQAHGAVDWAYIPVVAAAPELFGFSDCRPAATLARALSAGVLGSVLSTRAEWGGLPLLSFRTHLTLDAASGVVALAAPWALGFAGHRAARNTFLALGVLGLAAGLVLTEPAEMPGGS